MNTSAETVDSAQQAVLDEAAKVNDERMQAVHDLAAGVSQRVQLEAELAEAEKEEKRLIAAAEKAGWTAAQVKRFIKTAKQTPKRRAAPQPSTPEPGEDVSLTN